MANEVIKTFTEANFEQEVLKCDKPVLVDFWASWCGPCRMVSPLIDQLAEEYEGRAVVGKVNVDEEASLAIQYNVMTIPTVIVFKKGEIVEQVSGAYPKAHFEEMLNQAL
ncbi:MAG: thioredoxin [Clostridia bacterium]|nr:thioredoxin [Clostridia bacterium]